MNDFIKVGCVDPSHKNLGMARVLVNPATLELTPLSLKLAQTEPTKNKKVRKSSDDLSRAKEHAEDLKNLEEWADLIMAEVPSGSQSARSCLGAGVCIGLLASLRKPLIEVSPTEAKKAVIGRGTATKDEMINWAYGEYPNLNWLKSKSSRRPSKLIDDNEHLADALAIGKAGVKTPEFRAAAAMHMALKVKTDNSVNA